MRLFVALAIPDEAARPLALLQAGVPGARWQARAQLHLTLRFIGDVDGRTRTDIDDALSRISVPAFMLSLKGVGAFGGKRPHALWAGVAPSDPLIRLQKKIEVALQRIGLAPEGRKYTPHVTLASLKGTPPGAVMDFLADHALFAGTPFAANAFILYSSLLTPNGSIYRAERAYPLAEGGTP